MTKHSSAVHDQDEPQHPTSSKRQGTVVLIKKDTKKPARQKTSKTKTATISEPSTNSSWTNSDVEARITERAYELFHGRGGHHGQDLDDWLTAEREVLSEESR